MSAMRNPAGAWTIRFYRWLANLLESLVSGVIESFSLWVGISDYPWLTVEHVNAGAWMGIYERSNNCMQPIGVRSGIEFISRLKWSQLFWKLGHLALWQIEAPATTICTAFDLIRQKSVYWLPGDLSDTLNGSTGLQIDTHTNCLEPSYAG